MNTGSHSKRRTHVLGEASSLHRFTFNMRSLRKTSSGKPVIWFNNVDMWSPACSWRSFVRRSWYV